MVVFLGLDFVGDIYLNINQNIIWQKSGSVSKRKILFAFRQLWKERTSEGIP
jgi:hypothetical protein